ncbi:damage-control phosphatase ARMT1 family protein [Streptomyces sp. ST2-7A]|uniref:damage-control phosphatase ARMT1 family protein n=1 Tax=Streptomyces sp. ST2-7A TaxID=2907214 RepID=UPI001F2873A1|nr:damage-control phosphatase ARMT1 family protein [Streptomyces sp. ST2-7A]MCE7080974.1 protein-glutamate O-methyltransferase family protein [Streptomyces sp. ST2-7A]
MNAALTPDGEDGTAGVGGGRPGADDEAPVIRGNIPGSFPRSVLEERHPALVDRVRRSFPYGAEQQRALDVLLTEIDGGDITPLPADAHEHEQWAEWGYPHHGRRWLDVPFLWAESFFYRRLLEAVSHFGPGPWRGLDPFAPVKHAELRSGGVDTLLEVLHDLGARPAEDRLRAFLLASVQANRADLSFEMISGGGLGEGEAALVVDEITAARELLEPGPEGPGTVAVIADNSGRELIADLALIDHLLVHGLAGRVALHVKPAPYYVSDAVLADVMHGVRRLSFGPGRAAGIGERLWEAIGTGRLTISAHPFFCAPLSFAEMPADLRAGLAECSVTLLKGDLNYRRLVGDRLWPATTPFAPLVAHFPSPLVALRLLKSDVVTGLSAGTVNRLTATEDGWRISGAHAVVQTAGG